MRLLGQAMEWVHTYAERRSEVKKQMATLSAALVDLVDAAALRSVCGMVLVRFIPPFSTVLLLWRAEEDE